MTSRTLRILSLRGPNCTWPDVRVDVWLRCLVHRRKQDAADAARVATADTVPQSAPQAAAA